MAKEKMLVIIGICLILAFLLTAGKWVQKEHPGKEGGQRAVIVFEEELERKPTPADTLCRL